MSLALLCGLLACSSLARADTIVRPHGADLQSRFATPDSYEREELPADSFGTWLRRLPLKPHRSPVRLFDGQRKANQHVHAAVVDIDVGERDLQQCADAVMRLRGEYLFAQQRHAQIAFRFIGDGKLHRYTDFTEQPSRYQDFRRYMRRVFGHANTRSLRDQLRPVDVSQLQAGDVFVQAGRPYGHAAIVVDTAVHEKTGDKLFLLAQSYMPAQDIHVLRNLSEPGIAPWYRIPKDGVLRTPEWIFSTRDLRRF